MLQYFLNKIPSNNPLNVVIDEAYYKGSIRLFFHIVLIVFIALWMWWYFFPFTDIKATPYYVSLIIYIRDVTLVVLVYYLLVFIVNKTYYIWWLLIIGSLIFYWTTFTLYYFSSVFISSLIPLKSFYPPSIKWYYTNVIDYFSNYTYWQLLFRKDTITKIQSFVFSMVMIPTLIKVVIEILRKQARNAWLTQQYTQLELNFLKSQFNPHFLFNALNSVYSVTLEESPQAADMVLKLASMMRYCVYETTDQLVKLNKELDYIRNYISLESIRTPDRVLIDAYIDEDVGDSLLIAPFIMMIFVENAFKHGIHSTIRDAWVIINIGIEGNKLTLKVSNNNPTLRRNITGGIGLKNVKKRLNILYEGTHTLKVEENHDSYNVELVVKLIESNVKHSDKENYNGFVSRAKVDN